jgi:membrane protein implicated in regulation of membrane protease activity
MNNSSGKPDAMWTLVFMSFVITTFVYFISSVGTIAVGTIILTLAPFDVGYAGVVLVPLLMAYFGRRYTTDSLEASIKRAQVVSSVKKVTAVDDSDHEFDDEVLK